MMTFLLTVQWTLTAAALCAAWRCADDRRAAWAARAVYAMPLLTLAAAASLLLSDQILVWTERIMMLTLAALTGSLWLFGLARIEARPGLRARMMHSAGWTGVCWISLSALLQGAFLLTASWIAVINFLLRNQAMMPVWRWVWLALIGAIVCGGLLTAAVLAGTAAILDDTGLSSSGSPSTTPEATDRGRLPRLGYLTIGIALLRAGVIAGSLALWMSFCPFGSNFFISRTLQSGLNYILLRVLLGVILPMLFALLALLAWHGEGRAQAAMQFLPALIVGADRRDDRRVPDGRTGGDCFLTPRRPREIPFSSTKPQSASASPFIICMRNSA